MTQQTPNIFEMQMTLTLMILMKVCQHQKYCPRKTSLLGKSNGVSKVRRNPLRQKADWICLKVQQTTTILHLMCDLQI
jgi:hypothetical protein